MIAHICTAPNSVFSNSRPLFSFLLSQRVRKNLLSVFTICSLDLDEMFSDVYGFLKKRSLISRMS